MDHVRTLGARILRFRSIVPVGAIVAIVMMAMTNLVAVANDPMIIPPLDALHRHDSASPEGDPLKRAVDWSVRDADAMAAMMRSSLDVAGISPDLMDASVQRFLVAVQRDDREPLTAWVEAVAERVPSLAEVVSFTSKDPLMVADRLDPSGPLYTIVESLPPEIRAGLRTFIGRDLVRARYYDEALPVFAEVDPAVCPDAATLLFYRGSCYHALLKTKESLADLRQLLQNEDDIPVRYSRTATLLVADLKPLKEDSLDEISRLMTDVTRRLDLGRPGEETQQREQLIVDKLTKLIDKLEEQQKQQQQQQNAGGGGGQGSGQASPMEESQAGGASGQGDVDRKSLGNGDGWGNLPPAERQESLQQISRDLPTHYREAIEAYFRKMATQK